MMRVIDVFTHCVSQSAPREHVRNIVLVCREASYAHGACDSISSYLNCRTMTVFVRDDSCYGPYLCTVTGRERIPAIEELAAFTAVQGSRALRDFLERASDDQTIQQRFCA